MKTYRVMLLVHANVTSKDVRAKSFADAANRVAEEHGLVTICHQCSDEVEFGDVYTAIVTDERGKQRTIRL